MKDYSAAEMQRARNAQFKANLDRGNMEGKRRFLQDASLALIAKSDKPWFGEASLREIVDQAVMLNHMIEETIKR